MHFAVKSQDMVSVDSARTMLNPRTFTMAAPMPGSTEGGGANCSGKGFLDIKVHILTPQLEDPPRVLALPETGE